VTGLIDRLMVSRRLEIFIAGMSFFFGCWLLMPAVSMRTAAYAGLLRLMSEGHWGAMFLLNGLNHALALAINGARWWSPIVRWVASFSTMGLGILWGWGFSLVDPASTAVFMYFYIALGGGWCAVVAWRDSVRAARMEAAHGVVNYR
jgi:hypothetical protein